MRCSPGNPSGESELRSKHSELQNLGLNVNNGKAVERQALINRKNCLRQTNRVDYHRLAGLQDGLEAEEQMVDP